MNWGHLQITLCIFDSSMTTDPPMVMSWQWYSDGMHWMAQSNIYEPLILDSKLIYFR